MTHTPRFSFFRALAQLALWLAVLGAAVAIAQGGEPILAAGVGLAGLVIVDGAVRRWRRWWGRLAGTILLIVSAAPLTVGLVQLWARHAPVPEPGRLMIFHGVEYVREVIGEDEPVIVHIMIIDLAAEGVSVIVTPPDFPGAELPMKARMASQFMREFDVQVAINANHFSPFRKQWPDIYPFPGDPVTVLGQAACDGEVYGRYARHVGILDVHGPSARIEMPPLDDMHMAVAGIGRFVLDGKPNMANLMTATVPRTAAAIDASGQRLILAATDGEIGVSLPALADLLIAHGAATATSLDGGGSATLVIEGRDGGPQLVNVPYQGPFPYVERPVGNHLGIRARPLND